MKLPKSYKSVADLIIFYWDAYGRFPALIKSPYLHISLAFTAFFYPEWSSNRWWLTVLSVIPNLLGFTLGGYAILLAVGDDGFRKLITAKEPGEKHSIFISVSSSFVHFIVLQLTALLLAIAANNFSSLSPAKSKLVLGAAGYIDLIFWEKCFNFVLSASGYFFFIYAVMASLAAALSILRMTKWYELFINNK